MTDQRVLYIDPWMGVAGDMLMAALLDTDRDGTKLETVLRGSLAAIGLDPDIVIASSEMDQGLRCTRVRVREEACAPLRHLSDITRILEGGTLPKRISDRARAAFERLARVEAGIHGCGVDEVHFHELGAVDTIVDVVGVLSLVEALGVEHVRVGEIPVGGGSVEVAHGRMRVPAPATAVLLEGYRCVGGPEMRELTTPTGALLLRELGAISGLLPAMSIDKIGYGCGTMRFAGSPNVVRAILGRLTNAESAGCPTGRDDVVELETNLDDISPEIIGHATRVLRAAGALEVWTTPAFMKKDRPGVVLHVLVGANGADSMSNLIMLETGTLGVRRSFKHRAVAGRDTLTVNIAGTEVRVKWGHREGEIISIAPEYDDAQKAAETCGLPLREVMFRAVQEARGMLASAPASERGGAG